MIAPGPRVRMREIGNQKSGIHHPSHLSMARSFSTVEPSGEVCVSTASSEYGSIWLPVAGPGPEAAIGVLARGYGYGCYSIIRECHRWRYRDNLKDVASDVLHLPKEHARR